ncbi:hypothetical protein ACI2L1_03920 [Streptomyces sp. NPDC019531]|uniref:hypothetical protein n=1 Tax=Streptomyces sp. NPDC019531 TaxID=3365062 RepID=UPI00384C4F13
MASATPDLASAPDSASFLGEALLDTTGTGAYWYRAGFNPAAVTAGRRASARGSVHHVRLVQGPARVLPKPAVPVPVSDEPPTMAI